jgi:hypothetical protein
MPAATSAKILSGGWAMPPGLRSGRNASGFSGEAIADLPPSLDATGSKKPHERGRADLFRQARGVRGGGGAITLPAAAFPTGFSQALFI